MEQRTMGLRQHNVRWQEGREVMNGGEESSILIWNNKIIFKINTFKGGKDLPPWPTVKVVLGAATLKEFI